MDRYEEDYNEEDYRAARKQVKAKKQFYQELVAYVFTIGFLAFINLFTSPRYLWFLWPALGWGIGLLFRAMKVYGDERMGSDWEDREMRKALRRRNARRKPSQEALPTPRQDLLDETKTVRERLRPKSVRRDYDDSEFV